MRNHWFLQGVTSALLCGLTALSSLAFAALPDRSVNADGIELKRIILQYMKNKTSSPYGSNINCWDVSLVTNMDYAFQYDPEMADDLLFESFNEPLDCWDTSNV